MPDSELLDGAESRPNTASVKIIRYAKFFSRSHDAVIHIYDDDGNVIETHEHKGDFKEWKRLTFLWYTHHV